MSKNYYEYDYDEDYTRGYDKASHDISDYSFMYQIGSKERQGYEDGIKDNICISSGDAFYDYDEPRSRSVLSWIILSIIYIISSFFQ